MKSKRKLVIGVVALCLTICATIGVVAAVLAAPNASASSTFSVSYTASPQINASVSAGFGTATYGVAASSVGFDAMTIDGISSATQPHRFYPTASTSNFAFDEMAQINLEASKFFIVKYVFKNYSNLKAINLTATITQTQSVSGHNPFDVFYYQPNNTNDVNFVSTEAGVISAPTLTSFVSGTTQLTVGVAGGASVPTESHIYLVFTLSNPELYGGSLNSVEWNLSPAA